MTMFWKRKKQKLKPVKWTPPPEGSRPRDPLDEPIPGLGIGERGDRFTAPRQPR
jgi:hypothetical protein